MAYTNSPLATVTMLSPNCTKPRNHAIDTVTIHCFVGQVTAKRGCECFMPLEKKASCNYVVGYDGSVGLCVEECNRSKCTSSAANDNRAVTIEVASDSVYPYSVTDAAYEALIQLVADICKRNNIKKLLWRDDKKLVGVIAEQNMSVHRWFANKSCPGQFLYQRHGEIAQRVNEILEEKEMTQEQFDEMFEVAMAKHRSSLQDNDCGEWSEAARSFCIEEGIFNGSGRLPNGELNYMWQDMLTREQCAQLIYNVLKKYGVVKAGDTA